MFKDLSFSTIQKLNKKGVDNQNEAIYEYIDKHYKVFECFFSTTAELLCFCKSVNREMSLSTLETILANITSLETIKKRDFTVKNISCILRDSRSNLTHNIKVLLDFTEPRLDYNSHPLYDAGGVKYTLLSYLRLQGFEPNNLSSMLRGSGSKLATNIVMLHDFTKPMLRSDNMPLCDSNNVQYTLLSYLLAQGFEPRNISSMLINSGSKLAANIAALHEFAKPMYPPLCDSNNELYTRLSYLLAQGFDPSKITTKLQRSGAKLAANIEELVNTVQANNSPRSLDTREKRNSYAASVDNGISFFGSSQSIIGKRRRNSSDMSQLPPSKVQKMSLGYILN